jgi:hypothetical protein
LLVYRTMYDDFKNLISVNQHGFMKNRSMAKNLLEYASLVLNSIEGGWEVDSVYTEFLKAFDRVRHQLLLEKMSMSIETARYLRSYLKGRIQRIRIGDAVSKEYRVTSSIPQGNKLYKRFGGHHERERLWFVRSWRASCLWSPFYDVRVDKVERVQMRFIRYALRGLGSEFLRIGFHRTNYGVHEPMSAAMRDFNEVIGLFDFILTRYQFMNRLKLM